MKKLIIAIAAAFISTNAMALDIINPGSETGVFRQILTSIGEQVPHTFIQASNPMTAALYLNSDPVLTIWSSEWPGDPATAAGPTLTADDFVALMTYETVICSREFNSIADMSGKDVAVASWGSASVAEYLAEFGAANNINFTVIPYDGSGATTAGYVGRDADTIFTIESRKPAILEDGSACIAASADGTLSYRFVDAIVTQNVDAETTSALKSILTDLSSTEEWATAYAGSTLYIDTSGQEQLDMFNAAVISFTPK